MLDAPRELKLRALEPLKLDGLPPNPPPDLDEPVEGMLRLPILSPPPLGDLPLPPRLDALGDPDSSIRHSATNRGRRPAARPAAGGRSPGDWTASRRAPHHQICRP